MNQLIPAFRIKATGEIVTLRPELVGALWGSNVATVLRHGRLMPTDYEVGHSIAAADVTPLTDEARRVLRVVRP